METGHFDEKAGQKNGPRAHAHAPPGKEILVPFVPRDTKRDNEGEKRDKAGVPAGQGLKESQASIRVIPWPSYDAQRQSWWQVEVQMKHYRFVLTWCRQSERWSSNGALREMRKRSHALAKAERIVREVLQ